MEIPFNIETQGDVSFISVKTEGYNEGWKQKLKTLKRDITKNKQKDQ